MFNQNKIYLLFFLMMILSLPGLSQKKEMEAAQSDFDNLQFNKAAEAYQKIIKQIKEDTPERQYSVFMLAECYRMMNHSDLAEPYYKQLAGSNFVDTNPVIYLRYASVLMTSGDIPGAKEYYLKYLKIKPDDEEANTGLKSCDWILFNQDKKAQVNVWDVKSLNSHEDDFGPAFSGKDFNEMIFTSNRFSQKTTNLDQWTGSAFSDLYRSSFSGNSWTTPALVEFAGNAYYDLHEGTPSLDGDFSTLYFTRCERMGIKRTFCQIWKSEKSGDIWKEPALVFRDSASNMGQPCISRDDLTLVFASDMKGSKGGKDIWVVKRESKDQDFGTPVPLGPGINTAGDEVFPYLFNDTTLYFSSNGYKGFGGWDIYRSILKKDSWSPPENLGAPFNSGYDDFGIIVKKPGEEGFFCSNRPGGMGGDDIYQFSRKNLLFTASGQVRDNMTLLSVKDVSVMLFSDHGDTARVLTDSQGHFAFDTSFVMENHAYDLVFRKESYFSEKEKFSTKNYTGNHDFKFDILLKPIPEKPIVLPEILYALDKWDLAPQYQDSLTQLIGLLKDNPNIVIELRSHTDTRGSDEYNEVLSQKRAQTVVDFIISQGIDPRRLVAKGYGEKVPRTLDKDIVRENYLFKKGTVLNDDFINGLPTKEIKEAAYQLNRRTEFSVLSKDFKP